MTPEPVFFENPDRSHCFQAVLRSVLHQAFPDRGFTWEELDRLTGKRPGCWTWPTTAVVRLREMGIEVVIRESFDYQDFADRSILHCRERVGSHPGPKGLCSGEHPNWTNWLFLLSW